MYDVITSIKDERVAAARELTTVAGRERARKCLLEGEDILNWALAAQIPIDHVFFHARLEEHPFLATLSAAGLPCFAVSDGILKKISDTNYLIPFIGVGQIDRIMAPAAPSKDFVIVLDDVRDHGNLGTIIRTARAFGIRDLLTTSAEVDIWYKKVIEASRGKVFDVRLQRFATADMTLTYLKQHGFQVVATSPYAPVLQSAARLQPKPIALVVGNETTGVCDEILAHADLVVQIPMSGQVESLNVGVATGISVYELKLKLVLTMLTNYIRTTLGREVNVAGKMIQLALDKRLHTATPFNSTQIILLMVLKCDDTMTLEQVSKDTATFGAERDALLQPLFTQGYIRYTDETRNVIQLTESGEQMLGQLWGIVEASEDELLLGFSEIEREQFAAYLRRLQANCTRILTGHE